MVFVQSKGNIVSKKLVGNTSGRGGCRFKFCHSDEIYRWFIKTDESSPVRCPDPNVSSRGANWPNLSLSSFGHDEVDHHRRLRVLPIRANLGTPQAGGSTRVEPPDGALR
jgi:hypothetical protein